MQTIFPLDRDGHALKLTTAFYYLPFGRCVNKPENGIKGHGILGDEAEESEDVSTAIIDSVALKDSAKEIGRAHV